MIDKKNIVFNIREGEKIKIKAINISGNTVFSDKKIIKQFKNTKSKNLIFFWRGKWDDKKLIEYAYAAEQLIQFKPSPNL